MTHYRKVWQQHHNASLLPGIEIHHIDGDHTNNNPANLIAIPVKEHYNIHYQQGDYAACLLIKKQRMILTKEERSDLSRRLAIQRAQEGTHPSQLMVQNGTHPFLGGKVQSESNKNRLKNGTHNFIGSSNPAYSRTKKTCEYCGTECFPNNYTRWHGEKCKVKAN